MIKSSNQNSKSRDSLRDSFKIKVKNIKHLYNKCDYDPKKPTIIYHITNKKIDIKLSSGKTKFGSMSYYQIIHRDNSIIEKLQDILEKIKKCNDNVLLVCSSEEKNISDILNKQLNIYITKKIDNFSIIHETNDRNKVVYMIYNKIDNKNSDDKNNGNLVKKITNVFSKDLKPFSFLGFNKKIDNITYIKKTSTGTFFYQYRNTMKPYFDYDLEYWWWYKWYFNVPPCATGRLIQISGTCWFNTGINIALISPTLSKCLILKWLELDPEKQKKYMQDINFDYCFNPNTKNNESFREMIYYLIYHILIKKTKLSYKSGNIVKKMAAITKKISLEIGKEIKGYSPSTQNIESFEKKIHLKKSELSNKIIKDSLKNSDGFLSVTSIDLILFVLFENKNDYLFTSNFNFKDKNIKKSNFKEINDIQPINNKIKTLNLDIYNKIIEKNSVKTLPNILNIMGNFLNFKNSLTAPRELKINLNGKEEIYELEAGLLLLYNNSSEFPFHSIAGLICNGDEYIYDANNFIAKTNWTKNEYFEYDSILRENKVYYSFSKKGIESLIYIKKKYKKNIEKKYELVTSYLKKD